ncbi:hypothetical protein CERZMDRAFT_98567 [Cercospora zeae-maydis SCOH1-5]|uniref:Zn(2)-C6 fungal-type domain-containing protein n=1 Tax=Cercospora zeae-maydis SCOH1-5 TaxID=717836 RepID=A0A6A6FCZ7_9PEZI|nr:hypothetical protein CERZMDRAFT_98567 [Cercospora zeae-maydis SCOH1-5]
MFASFAISSDGLMHAAPPPRLARSHHGCLPCRRKRKKCDETKPRCLRCMNSTNRDTCVWPQCKPERRDSSVESAPADLVEIVDDDQEQRDENDHTEEVTVSRENDDVWSVKLPSIQRNDLDALSPWQLPEAVARVSPDLSAAKLTQATLALQRRMLCHESEFSGSIFMLGLPGSNSHPGYIHAWTACSMVATAPQTVAWQQRALMHHSQACVELRKGIRDSADDDASGEWMRATVLMLYLFEKQRSQRFVESGQGYNATAIHLNAMHHLFDERKSVFRLKTFHSCMLYEAYITRTVDNYLFQPDSTLALDHVTRSIDYHEENLRTLGFTKELMTSPWVELWGRKFTDLVYQLSWLAHQSPFNQTNTERLQAIAAQLSSKELIMGGSLHGIDADALKYYTDARLAYWHACSFFVEAMLDGCLRCPASTFQQDHVRAGMELMDQLTMKDHVNAHLTWPLVVLGFGVDDVHQLKAHKEMLGRLALSAGEESVHRAKQMVDCIFKTKMANVEAVPVAEWMRLIVSFNMFS